MKSIQNVYVGNFKSIEECKDMRIKLNQKGFKAVPYNLIECFTLRVGSFDNYLMAYNMVLALKKEGFIAFILNI